MPRRIATVNLGPRRSRASTTSASSASPPSRSPPPAPSPPSSSTRDPTAVSTTPSPGSGSSSAPGCSAARCWRCSPGSRWRTVRCARSRRSPAWRARSPARATPRSASPSPTTEDEVGELARTMDGMLQALDEAHSEREQSLERQREFVADASHELRTPLTSIQANLELLQAGGLGSEDDRHAVDSALTSTKRMSGLVSDLLLLARADAGRRVATTDMDLAADRRRRARGGPASRRRPPAREPARGTAAAAGQPGRAPPTGPQPARERGPAYAGADHGRAHRPP